MKRELQRQKIDSFLCGRREQGEVTAAAGLGLLCLLLVVLTAQFQIIVMSAVSQSMEDALAASELASAVADIREYGISHRIAVTDFDSAYRIFCNALKDNLGLNDMWEKENGILFSGNLQIERYILYNVYDGRVYAYERTSNGNTQEYAGSVGNVTAPDGKVIENTSVYSEISFPVRLFGGIEQTAHKGKLVDICLN